MERIKIAFNQQRKRRERLLEHLGYAVYGITLVVLGGAALYFILKAL